MVDEKGSCPDKGFGEENLLIRLKIREHEDEEEETKYTNFCRVCNKVFMSGKALGGHMRIHAQDLKKHDDDKKPNCVVCGKDFPSMKSLFGHMRCHPDREWRGINPPPASIPMTDELPDLPKWSVTAKRGRSRKPLSNPSTSASSFEEDEEDELHEAAYGVMLLLKNDPRRRIEVQNPPLLQLGKEMTSRSSGSSGSSDGGYVRFSSHTKNPKRQRIEDQDPDQDQDQPLLQLGKEMRSESTNGYDQCSSDDDESKNTQNIPKKKIKKMKLNDLNPQNIENKHKCITCGKSFSTHQALGGHRSSHNKTKIVIQNANDLSSITRINDKKLVYSITQVEEKKNSDEGVALTYECNICNKVFYSGQALGGHKRCHWSGPLINQASSSLTISMGEISQSGKRILDFDLNETPMESEEFTGFGNSIA